MTTLSDLNEGEEAIVLNHHDENFAPKLIEMGFLPGAKVKMFKKAPLGCPLCFMFEDSYQVSLRTSQAASIEVSIETQKA